jgi:hypothetical protein
MKRMTFILFIIISVITLPQSEFITQITNYSYDSRNPDILTISPYSGTQGEFVFEIHEVNSINIGLINYFSDPDSFSTPIRITENNFRNIKPSITNHLDGRLVVVFETDQEGNEDIALSVEESGIWSNPVILTSSADDEINPSFLLHPIYDPLDTLWILYERNNSIHLLSYRETVTSDRVIFQADDSVTYSDADGVISSSMNFVAVKHYPGSQIITGRSLNNVNGNLSPEDTICAEGIPGEPKIFYQYSGSQFLTFTIKPASGYQNVYYNYYYPVISDPVPLIDNPTGDISLFECAPVDIITETSVGLSIPSTYLVKRNDSSFVRMNNDTSNPFDDTLLYIKAENPGIDVGLMGEDAPYLVYFTIFEDSSDGYINLFARKENVLIDALDEEKSKTVYFNLLQNYPNPFNPSTKLSFVIGHSFPQSGISPSAQHSIFVTLKVYDILGKEVATLVNEEKPAGSYSVEFNAKGLTSGIYFYRLEAGDFTKTMKMILMK